MSLKTVAKHRPEVTSHLTTGTLTHDLHAVKCFWDIGWLEITLMFKNICAEAVLARIASPTVSPLLPRQVRGPDPQNHFLLLLHHSPLLLTGTCWTCGAATVWTVAGVKVWMVPLAACVSTRWACTVCTCCWIVTGWTWEDVTRLWTWGWRTEKQKRCQKWSRDTRLPPGAWKCS